VQDGFAYALVPKSGKEVPACWEMLSANSIAVRELCDESVAHGSIMDAASPDPHERDLQDTPQSPVNKCAAGFGLRKEENRRQLSPSGGIGRPHKSACHTVTSIFKDME